MTKPTDMESLKQTKQTLGGELSSLEVWGEEGRHRESEN